MSSDKPTALITGASTGIGRSAAVALAKNGYDIVINYSRSEDAAKTTARKAEAAGANTIALSLRRQRRQSCTRHDRSH